MSVAVPKWSRRVPWHNWVFSGFYATTFASGVSAILAPPQNLVGQAGPVLTFVWALCTALAGIVGIFGALGPTIIVPYPSVRGGLHITTYKILAPNFRAEQTAAAIGWVGVFIYATTVTALLIFDGTPDRASAAWGVLSHFWPFLLRYLYFHFREHAEIEKREALQQMKRGLSPVQGASSEPPRP